MQNRFGNIELDVAPIVFWRLRGFVSSDELYFFFHSLISAGMEAGDGRSWQFVEVGYVGICQLTHVIG